MAGNYGYLIHMEDGENTEALITNALSADFITSWAYILHTSEYRVWSRHGYSSSSNSANPDFQIPQYMTAEIWHIVCITDKKYPIQEIASHFNIPAGRIRELSDRLYISEALQFLLNENINTQFNQSRTYSTDEVKSNFDFAKYIEDTKQVAKWFQWRHKVDLAMVFVLIAYMVINAVIVNLISSHSRQYPWVFPGIAGGIGILLSLLNLRVIRSAKKKNSYVAGVPFVGGFTILIAGLASPCKWLALLCLCDCTIWEFVSALRCKLRGCKNERRLHG